MAWTRVKVPPIETGEGLGERRLPHAGDALEQEVPVGEQAERRRLDGVVIPGDHPADVVDHPAVRLGGRTGLHVRLEHG